MTRSIINVMNDERICGDRFKKKSWANWKIFLKVLFCIPLDLDEMQIFKHCTGRSDLPSTQPGEVYLIIGRRGGKSLICAMIAVYLACFRSYDKYRAPGEQLIVMILAQDRSAARVLFQYISAFFDAPILSSMVVNRLASSIELSNHVSIEIHTSDYRSVRGRTVIACLGDELAFWPSSADGAASDAEILNAIRPAMATIPGSLLVCLSSPYAKRGELYRNYQEFYGKQAAPVLIWRADTLTMNPGVSSLVITAARLRDAVSASSEYDALFRSDLESFISVEVVEAAMRSWHVLPPLSTVRYMAFVDAAGGSGSDSYTCAIAHYEHEAVTLDCILEICPPFSPEHATQDICEVLRSYRISEVTGDRYAGDWPCEQFAKRGVGYRVAELNRSELYLELLPCLTAGRCALPNNTKLKNQLVSLERRVARSGKDSVDHAPGSHDDLANSAAGAVVEVLRANVTNVYGVLEFYKELAAGKYPELLDDPFLAKYNKQADPNANLAVVKTIPCDGNGCNGVMQQHANNVAMWTCSSCGRCVQKSAIVVRPMSRKEYFDAQGQTTRSGLSRGIFGRCGR